MRYLFALLVSLLLLLLLFLHACCYSPAEPSATVQNKQTKSQPETVPATYFCPNRKRSQRLWSVPTETCPSDLFLSHSVDVGSRTRRVCSETRRVRSTYEIANQTQRHSIIRSNSTRRVFARTRRVRQDLHCFLRKQSWNISNE